MKTFTKVCIIIGAILFSLALRFTIYEPTNLKKTTPEVYRIKCQFNTKDEVPVSFSCSYFAVLGDDPCKNDPYKNKEMCIKFISSEVLHEIFWDLCLADCLQKRDEILYDIRQNLTTKVTQKFPNIQFQVIDIAMVFEL